MWGPISSRSWNAKTRSGQPGRERMRWEPVWRLTVQPIRRAPPVPQWRRCWASRSRGLEGDVQELAPGLIVIEAVGHDPQGKRLDVGDRLVLRGTVGEHARQFDDLRYPAAVSLLFELDPKADGHMASQSIG